jgi:hypothetical protein
MAKTHPRWNKPTHVGNKNLTDKPRDGIRRTKDLPSGRWGADRQLSRGVPGDEVGQVLQRVVEVVLPERRELEVLAHLGRDR